MLIKFLFVGVSILVSLSCIIGLIKFEPEKHTFKRSILITAIYGWSTSVVDFILFLIIVTKCIPNGRYGTGVELITSSLTLAIFIPFYYVMGNNIYKKMRKIYPTRTDIKAYKSFWKTAIIKAIFVLVATLWIVEV